MNLFIAFKSKLNELPSVHGALTRQESDSLKISLLSSSCSEVYVGAEI